MTALLIILVFAVLLGAASLAFQIYQLTELDASCRNLKHPKFWGLFSLSGNNGSGGLILYLIGRRKYPITMTSEQQKTMASYKQKAGISLGFIAVSAILLIVLVLSGGIPF